MRFDGLPGFAFRLPFGSPPVWIYCLSDTNHDYIICSIYIIHHEMLFVKLNLYRNAKFMGFLAGGRIQAGVRVCGLANSVRRRIWTGEIY